MELDVFAPRPSTTGPMPVSLDEFVTVLEDASRPSIIGPMFDAVLVEAAAASVSVESVKTR